MEKVLTTVLSRLVKRGALTIVSARGNECTKYQEVRREARPVGQGVAAARGGAGCGGSAAPALAPPPPAHERTPHTQTHHTPPTVPARPAVL